MFASESINKTKLAVEPCKPYSGRHVLEFFVNETIFSRKFLMVNGLSRLTLRKKVRRFGFPISSDEICKMGRNIAITAVNTTINSSYFAQLNGNFDRSTLILRFSEVERYLGVTGLARTFNPFHFAHESGTIFEMRDVLQKVSRLGYHLIIH